MGNLAKFKTGVRARNRVSKAVRAHPGQENGSLRKKRNRARRRMDLAMEMAGSGMSTNEFKKKKAIQVAEIVRSQRILKPLTQAELSTLAAERAVREERDLRMRMRGW